MKNKVHSQSILTTTLVVTLATTITDVLAMFDIFYIHTCMYKTKIIVVRNHEFNVKKLKIDSSWFRTGG